MTKLSKDEHLVFAHVASEDVTPVGAVEGDAFRHLVALGLVEVEGERTFLSEYGWELYTDMRDDAADARDLDGMATT